MAGYLDGRAGEIDRLWSAAPLTFPDTEQALLLGHLVHPTPKSRGELGAVERQRFSPETGGRFALRWLAVDRDLVRHGSALDTPAPELAAALLRDDPAVDQAALQATREAVGGDRILLPAHPYEADRLAADPLTADLFDTGAVVDLGAWGAPFLPTTSVRTVYRADAPWQLKFSLHVRVTNSMRVTLPKELDRAVEAAALARTVVGARTREAAPHFVLVQDPAYLTLARDGEVLNGFSVLLRENRWQRTGRAARRQRAHDALPGPPVRRPQPAGRDRRGHQQPRAPQRGRRRPRVVRPVLRRRRALAGPALPRRRAVLRGAPAEHAGRAGGRLAGARRLPRQPGLLPPRGSAR